MENIAYTPKLEPELYNSYHFCHVLVTFCAELSKELREKLHKELGTELGLDRYKYVVQVVIGEQRGEGVK